MNLVRDMEKTLQLARETYGNKNQILVCIEELNELACVLAKYPRYDSEEEARLKLTDAAIDEVADVIIILDHVQNILQLSTESIQDRIKKKVGRLERWLNNSDSMQRTVEDRAVEDSSEPLPICVVCENSDNPEANMCATCRAAEAIDGSRPFYKPKKKKE